MMKESPQVGVFLLRLDIPDLLCLQHLLYLEHKHNDHRLVKGGYHKFRSAQMRAI